MTRPDLTSLAQGRARFTADLPLPDGCLHAEPVPAPHAHAGFHAVDAAPALARPAMLAAATTTRLSAGGVGPVPLLLSEPTDLAALPGQISPIDDVRGTADYRTRLLQHQVLAHLAALDADFDPLRRLP